MLECMPVYFVGICLWGKTERCLLYMLLWVPMAAATTVTSHFLAEV